MPKYSATGSVAGGKWLGIFEAENAEAAEDAAIAVGYVSLCHQCASECENAEITDVTVHEVSDEDAEEMLRG